MPMRFPTRVSIVFLFHVLPLPAIAAGAGWLIASQSESIAVDRLIELQVIRPSEKSPWPVQLHLRLVTADGSETRINLQAAEDVPADAYAGYTQASSKPTSPASSGQNWRMSNPTGSRLSPRNRKSRWNHSLRLSRSR